MPLTLVAHRKKKTEKILSLICEVIVDVVDLNMKTRPLTKDDRALIR